MRQAINNVKIAGQLAEQDIKYTSYTRDGSTVEAISGSIKIKVAQNVDGKPVDMEIPVYMFANKITKAGNENKAYTEIEKIKNEFISLATVDGNTDEADYVAITKGQLQPNEYYDKNNVLQSYPRVKGTFVNRLRKDKPITEEATFEVEMFITGMGYKVDADGNETEEFIVSGVVPGYGDRAEVLTFKSLNPKVTASLQDYWNIGDTVKAKGLLNFTATTETITEELGFGEPIVKIRSIFSSDLLIDGGSDTPYEEGMAYQAADIKQALAERMTRLEIAKEKSVKAAGNATAKPATDNFDLGF